MLQAVGHRFKKDMGYSKKLYFVFFCIFSSMLAINGNFAQASREEVNSALDAYGSDTSLISLYQRHIYKGNQCLAGGDYQEAKNEFSLAIEAMPQLPEGYLNLATLEMQEEDFEAARKLLMKAQYVAGDSYPKKDILFYNMAVCAQKMRDYEKAILYYSQALKANPALGEAMYNLGLTYQKTGNNDAAYLQFVDAKRIFQTRGQAAYAAKVDEALTGLTQTFGIDQTKVSEQLLIDASEAFKDNNIEQARELLEKSLALDPHNAQSYYRLGIIYASRGDFEKAVYFFNGAIENNPEFTKAYINLGSAYGKLKEYRRALKAFEAALKHDPGNPSIYHNIGSVYQALGEKSKAAKYYKKANSLKTTAHKS